MNTTFIVEFHRPYFAQIAPDGDTRFWDFFCNFRYIVVLSNTYITFIHAYIESQLQSLNDRSLIINPLKSIFMLHRRSARRDYCIKHWSI